MNCAQETRSRLYRRQILQIHIRWKALDEIYKLLHRSDLNITATFRQLFLAFSTLEILKSLQFFQNFVEIFADFHEICSGFQENAEKRCNFSKFLDSI